MSRKDVLLRRTKIKKKKKKKKELIIKLYYYDNISHGPLEQKAKIVSINELN